MGDDGFHNEQAGYFYIIAPLSAVVLIVVGGMLVLIGHPFRGILGIVGGLTVIGIVVNAAMRSWKR